MRLTNINNKTLSGYEKEVSAPDYESLALMAKLYSVSTDYLLGLTDTSPLLSKTPDPQGTAEAEPVTVDPLDDIKRSMIEAMDRMDPKIAEEVAKRAETAAKVFPKDKPDALPVRKMA